MFKKLNSLQSRLKKSQDGKALLSNFGYLMLLQIASYVFPLLTIPYLARVIGVDGFGKIAFASAVIVWLQTITDWGFNYTATRDVAQNRENPDKVAEIFSNVLWARILLMLVSLGLLLITIVTIPYFQENRAVLLATFLLIPGYILSPDWFFQALERMKYITIFNVLSKAIFTAAVFIFINKPEDFILQPIIMGLGYVICGIFAMYIITVKWQIKLQKPQFSQIILTIKNSTDVFINNIMPNLYNSLSIILLGFFGGSVANGLLDAGRKFVELAQQFLSIISRVFYPFLSRKIHRHSLYATFQLSLSFLFATLLILSAPLIIKVFFTPEFEAAVVILQIMAVSLIFASLNNIYGTNFLIIQGHEKRLRNITIITSIIGLCTAFPMIYYFDYIGAALTITLTRAMLGGAIMISAKRVKTGSLIRE